MGSDLGVSAGVASSHLNEQKHCLPLRNLSTAIWPHNRFEHVFMGCKNCKRVTSRYVAPSGAETRT